MLNSEKLARLPAGATVVFNGARGIDQKVLPDGYTATVKVNAQMERFIIDNDGDVLYGLPDEHMKGDGEYSIDMYSVVTMVRVESTVEVVEEPIDVLVAEIQHTDSLTLTPLNNGGWTIQVIPRHAHLQSLNHGAYTNIADLMVGLRDYMINGSD